MSMKLKATAILVLYLFFFFSGIKTISAAECGEAYQHCCAMGSACITDLSCIAGRCVPGSACGYAGLACCPGNTCKDPKLTCIPDGGCTAGPSSIGYLDPNKGCDAGAGAKSGINTAIGCISTTFEAGPNSFFGSIIKTAVGLGGALSLVLMLFGVFLVTTSSGIPDKLKEGQGVIVSAISGLIFIILSVFLLNLIGVNILGIPGIS
jgi:hypothetical protein